MIDYEKKYKDALGWMRKVYPSLKGMEKEDAEHYFPEVTKTDDDVMIDEIISHIEYGHSNVYDTRWVVWLNEVKERLAAAPKDMVKVYRPAPGTVIDKAAKETIRLVKQNGENLVLSFNSATILVDYYDTEETIRERYHKWCHGNWKPSEEQVEALRTAAMRVSPSLGANRRELLLSLYNDIKKLAEDE